MRRRRRRAAWYQALTSDNIIMIHVFFLVKTNDLFLFCLFCVIQNQVWRMPMSSLILRMAMITSRKIRPYCMKNQKLWRSLHPLLRSAAEQQQGIIFLLCCVCRSTSFPGSLMALIAKRFLKTPKLIDWTFGDIVILFIKVSYILCQSVFPFIVFY